MAALTLRDELVRAAVAVAYESRDKHGRCTREAVEEVVRVHRIAPLLDHRPVIDAVAEWLVDVVPTYAGDVVGDYVRGYEAETAEPDWYGAIEQRLAERRRESQERACAA